MSELTSKCRRKLCQAESAVSRDLFLGKYHVAGLAVLAAAVGGVDVPICATNVRGGCVAEGAGYAINRGRVAFEFEECAEGCFIEVQVQAAETETGAVLFVAEGAFKAEAREGGVPIGEMAARDYFPFGAFFVAGILFFGAVLGRGSLGCEEYPANAGALCTGGSWGCVFDADAEESAAFAQIGMGRVVEGVGFERAAVRGGAESSDGTDRGSRIGDRQLDLDFAVCFLRLRHGEV